MSVRQSQFPWLTDVFTTPGATPTTSAATTYIVPTGAGVYAEMIAIARNTATGATATIKTAIRAQNPAGTVALGTPLLIASDVAALAIAVAFTASTNTIVPQVTGVAATSIEWFLDVRYWVN